MTSVTPSISTDWETLVREHHASIWRYLRYLGATPAQADDWTQETFLAVFDRPFEERSLRETSAYLRTVARNKLLAGQRKLGREQPLPDVELLDSVWSGVEGDDRWDDYLSRLKQCLLEAIGDRARTAIQLHYGQQAPRAQIAEALSISVEGVKTMLRRAKSALHDCILKRQSYDES